MKIRQAVGLLTLMGLIFSACSGGIETPTPFPVTPTVESIPIQLPDSTPTPIATATPRPVPTPTTPATATPTPRASDVFTKISQSVPYIETSVSSGSGVLLEGGYVLTNSHVVWPYNAVRVVFPDGSEFLDVPVFARDLMADIALLGPIDTDLPPLRLEDGEGVPIGTDTFLVGYPGEFERFPQPSFSRGLVSRFREWPAADLTIIQTDHSTAGGQSGGALVSQNGGVIGISTFGITEAGFSGSLSSSDIEDRISRLLDGENTDQLGNRVINREDAVRSANFSIHNEWDHASFAVVGLPGSTANLNVSGVHDAYYTLLDPFGEYILATVDGSYTGDEPATFQFGESGIAFVDISQFNFTQGTFSIECDCDIIPINDLDDGGRLYIGLPMRANLDYPGDADYFLFDLADGEAVEVTIDSMNVDGWITASWIGAGVNQSYADDDSGGGPFGWNPRLVFRAPYTGTFILWISDAGDIAEGGYYIEITQADPDNIDAVPPPRRKLSTPFGEMTVYEFQSVQLEIEYPSAWIQSPPVPELQLEALFSPGGNIGLSIFDQDLEVLGLENLELDAYVDLLVETSASGPLTIDGRNRLTTSSGLIVERLDMTSEQQGFSYMQYVTVFESEFGARGLLVTLTASSSAAEDSQELFEYILNSWRTIQ